MNTRFSFLSHRFPALVLHLPISHGAYSHLFAVADDNAPLTIVQAVWLSSSCRTFHLGTQSQRDDWLTYAFSGVLCSPWDFSCG